jgi:hypothetical protein
MRTLAALAFAVAALGFTACADDPATYHNAITGAVCSPDPLSYVPPGTKGSHHAGCDDNRCCIDQGECHNSHTPDAGIVPNPP